MPQSKIQYEENGYVIEIECDVSFRLNDTELKHFIEHLNDLLETCDDIIDIQFIKTNATEYLYQVTHNVPKEWIHILQLIDETWYYTFDQIDGFFSREQAEKQLEFIRAIIDVVESKKLTKLDVVSN